MRPDGGVECTEGLRARSRAVGREEDAQGRDQRCGHRMARREGKAAWMEGSSSMTIFNLWSTDR